MLPTTEHLAVVLGMFETGLAVGRSLGRAGIQVLGLDCAKKVGFYSKYIQASICPHPLEQEAEFVDYLLEISSGQKLKPVLFVTSDDFVMSVSRNRGRLEDSYLMNMPACDLLETITDKLKQYELASRVGIPVPRTWVASDRKQLLEIQDEIAFPAFVKGRELTSWRTLVGTNRKGFLVQTNEELITVCRRLFEISARGLIQEVIPGPDTNHFKASYYISQKGDVLLAFGLQKIRQKPAGFGYGCVVQSVHYPELLELGQQLLTTIGYRGVGSAEFKLDRRTGRLNLIELNPRYWQQNALAERCGMNFPVVNHLDVTGSAPGPVAEYQEGIKWINIYDDFESFQSYRRKGELSTRAWLRSLKGPKVLSDLALDDIRPFVSEWGCRRIIAGALRAAMSRAREAGWRTGSEASAGPVGCREEAADGDRRSSLSGMAGVGGESYVQRVMGESGARTLLRACARSLVGYGRRTRGHAVERRRMHRIRHQPAALTTALTSAKHILIVCHGNMIRSVFAARLIARDLGDHAASISSAGLEAVAGKPAHPTAVLAATTLGVDLNRHTTAPVAPEAVANADLIFVMEIAHLVSIQQRFPEIRAKTFLLTCLAPVVPLEIRDPVGGDASEFQACFDHICRAVRPIARLLSGSAPSGSLAARPSRLAAQCPCP